MKDFYLDDRNLAAYFEKDWADHFPRMEFKFSPFEGAKLYCDYHEKFVEFLNTHLQSRALTPRSVLEIGSALGRNYFEVARQIPSVKTAILVEPSANLNRGFRQIFEREEVANVTVLHGNVATQQIAFNTEAIRAATREISCRRIESPFQDLAEDLGEFDLVICSNVIDQCRDPEKLIDVLKRSTANGGVIALSCSYQWQEKYIGNATDEILNINNLFAEGWHLLGDTNLTFQFRKFERYWMTFLSHVAVFSKL